MPRPNRTRSTFAAVAGVLALAMSVIAPTAASADELTVDEAQTIPAPGEYLGSTTIDEADPGEASATAGTEAISLKNFSAGNLISDSLMYTSGTMATSQIQSFLNGKVPSCQKGYTCLKNFTQKTTTKKPNTYCSGTYKGSAKESAASIISKAAKACGISEKVLLVILQKEQGLVTHTWPSDFRYDIAMGFACPDNAACDPQFFGFQNQVYMAAKQLRRYSMDSGFNWYPVGETSQVRYHPNNSCGTSAVKIENKATAALYYYTPYQPNNAALSAGYGVGDSCSSYGNRNFVNYYTDWFGGSGSGGSTPVPNPRDAKPVARFWSSAFDNAHFYTVSETEADTLMRTDKNWAYEGTGFRAWTANSNSCREGTIPVYRFWSSAFESHFYTTNQSEMKTVRDTDKNWSYEGAAFCTAAKASSSTTPVYRFWSEKFGKHFYTSNAAESQDLQKNDKNWTYEGVALYAPK